MWHMDINNNNSVVSPVCFSLTQYILLVIAEGNNKPRSRYIRDAKRLRNLWRTTWTGLDLCATASCPKLVQNAFRLIDQGGYFRRPEFFRNTANETPGGAG